MNENTAYLLWVLSVGFVGGLLNTKKNSSKLKNSIDMMSNILSSMFLCWIVYEVADYFFGHTKISAAIGGFFAFRGTEWVVNIVDKIINQKVEK